MRPLAAHVSVTLLTCCVTCGVLTCCVACSLSRIAILIRRHILWLPLGQIETNKVRVVSVGFAG